MSPISQDRIDQIVFESKPEPLSGEGKSPIPDDHAAHIVQLVQWGQAALAADHLLFVEINPVLVPTVSGVIRQLNILFDRSALSEKDSEQTVTNKTVVRQYAYEFLIETALNFYGLESRWLDQNKKGECLHYLANACEGWENQERKEGQVSVASAVLRKWLVAMKRVQKGNSMAAKTAARIEGTLDFEKNVVADFLNRAEKEIKENIYSRIIKEGKCKFGNDYALGLRWLRHLGFEQVSTNPVLAARAYQDEPALVEAFRREAKRHPDFELWTKDPSRHGEEIALFATLLALWDNLHIFRPIFFNLQDVSGGGVVSFQLNPNIAHLAEESVRDVFKAFGLASENLLLYDRYLLSGYAIQGEKGRPNMVIKVAATTPAARTITRTINAFGFGSNITVDYTVSQEATLILEEINGMACALKKGIRPTQLYMTNMGGRLESHLREVKLEVLFHDLKERIGEQKALEKVALLSEANGTKEKVAASKNYEQKVIAGTRFAHGQKTIDDAVCEALKEICSKKALQDWESAIGQSGTFVARRVWGIFFSEKNRERWVFYLMKKKGLTSGQAGLILDRIHYLPASKRKPFDTFWTLASRNLVHTEFPDHQENVRRMAEGAQFNLKTYEESISHAFASETLEQLNAIEDFRRAYEINPELAEVFKEVGIPEEFGGAGLKPEDWETFGPVQKTLAEFKNAYDTFQQEMISLIRQR
jgi:hypothetical protein